MASEHCQSQWRLAIVTLRVQVRTRFDEHARLLEITVASCFMQRSGECDRATDG
jgi:hypothetical protein